jgi:hypothetical protein
MTSSLAKLRQYHVYFFIAGAFMFGLLLRPCHDHAGLSICNYGSLLSMPMRQMRFSSKRQCGGDAALTAWANEQGIIANDTVAIKYRTKAPLSLCREFSFVSEDLLDPSKTVQLTRRGLAAIRPIKKGQVFARLPFSLMFTVKLLARSRLGAILKEAGIKHTQIEGLALLLLWEINNPPSMFDEWLCTLPEEYHTSNYWPEKKLEKINARFPGLADATRDRESIIRASYNRLFPLLFEKFPNEFPRSAYSYERFKWASIAVYSRHWNLPESADKNGKNLRFMGPLVDLVNHEHADSVSTYHMDYEEREFVFTATKDYVPGEEIFIFYSNCALVSPHSAATECNTYYLLDYGFYDPRNTESC